MSGGGGGEGKGWIGVLVAGIGLCLAGSHLHHGGGWVGAGLLGVGGLMVVFGSCEAMIKAVEGIGERLGWNEFVAGTMAGLASNVPEIVMLAFVILTDPRVAFVVVALTLHVNALVFGIYCGLLPRDAHGAVRLPVAMVKISTDLFATAAGIFLTTGSLMILLKSFDAGDHKGEGLGAADLVFMGCCLLFVQGVAIQQMIRHFSGSDEDTPPGDDAPDTPEAPAGEPPSVASIAGYGLLGSVTAVFGGHAVGDFADALVAGLRAQGFSEMVGAIMLSLFAGSGAFLMAATAHAKGKYDLALANVSGAVAQVPFVVMPVCMILMAVFAQLGKIPRLPHGGVLAIDLETTSVMLFSFPIMLILYKSIEDDGTVNWIETAGMVAVFALIVFFLAVHG